ncbi:MAG: hypothetical protein CM15mV3_2570 [Caudoviricetes sp.]|nr:MAG: hypothetical protein CM15mV3_2570 [Caudoviricetes sp.]
MGSIGQVPGSTSTINNADPSNSEAFVTGPRSGQFSPNPAYRWFRRKDGTAKTGGGLSDGTKRGDGEDRVDAGTKN